MRSAKIKMDHSSTLWGLSLESLELWGFRLLLIGAVAGVGGLVVSAISAYVLYVAGTVDVSRVKVELADAQAALETAQNNAKQIDANLLREQRLTAEERWRLRHIERAVLPRSQFVDWAGLNKELKAGKFQPINIAVVEWPIEARTFGMDLMVALRDVGLLKKSIILPFSASRLVPFSSSGSLILLPKDGDANASALAKTLWKYGMAGGSVLNESLPPEWATVLGHESWLVVLENGRWSSPRDGQDGEGLDEHGRPVPPR